MGQGLGEDEELGDGVFGAGDAHLDSVAADRDAGRQVGEPAVEGGHGDRDADPGAAGPGEVWSTPGRGGRFRPGRGRPSGAAGAGGAARGGGGCGWSRCARPRRPRIRVAARARETPKSDFEVAADEQGPVERLELRDSVGEGEEPTGV